jgi:protein TIF31
MSAIDNEPTGEDVAETFEEGGNPVVVDAHITLPNKTVVVVAGLSAGETITAVRQVLGEYQETAAFTCYSLHCVGSVGADGVTTELDIAAPEYIDLMPFVQENSATLLFNLVPAEYNLKKVQDHLKRTNEVLLNPPSIKGAINKKEVDAAAAQPSAESKVDNALPKTDDLFKPIDFGAFYGEVLYRTGNVENVAKNARMSTNKPIAEAVKSVFASGWNPPPPQRKLRGDLLYIEVVTANEGTLYITAVPTGFYVNKSNRSHFDATPANNHCFSHELLDTLLKASASLKAAWASAVTSRYLHYLF